MATATAINNHPYFAELNSLFYNYRLSHLNRRYYTAILERFRFWNLTFQIATIVLTAVAVTLLSIVAATVSPESTPAALGKVVTVSILGAVLSGLAFVVSVLLLVLNLTQRIDDATTRVHAWHYAEQQIESAMRFVKNNASSRREAKIVVDFANEAYHVAAHIPETDRVDQKLNDKITHEVNEALPPDYIWTAL